MVEVAWLASGDPQGIRCQPLGTRCHTSGHYATNVTGGPHRERGLSSLFLKEERGRTVRGDPHRERGLSQRPTMMLMSVRDKVNRSKTSCPTSGQLQLFVDSWNLHSPPTGRDNFFVDSWNMCGVIPGRFQFCMCARLKLVATRSLD